VVEKRANNWYQQEVVRGCTPILVAAAMGSCMSALNEACYVCCCAGFLNPNGEGSKEFYEIMGLEKTATHAEIRRAWKKLSLQFHPDKLAQRGETLTDEMREKFRKIKRAHEVLSDPERRKIYDSLGINGIDLKEEPESFMRDPSKVQEILNEADWRATLIVYFAVFAVLGYLLAFPILFALEADDTIDIAWYYVFFPLWILYFVILMAHLANVLSGPTPKPDDIEEDEEWVDTNPLSTRIITLFQFCLFISWNAVLCARLDGTITCDWTIALLPYFVWDAINLWTEYSGYYANEPPELGESSTVEQQEEFIMKSRQQANYRDTSRYVLARLVQVLFVALKADDNLGWDWWAAMLPIWIYTFSLLVGFCGYRAAAADPESDQEFASGKMTQLCATCCLMTLFGLMLGFYLDEAPDDRFSFFWFYFPFGIAFGVPLVCVLCVIPLLQLLGLAPKDLGDLEEAAGADAASGDEGGTATENPVAENGSYGTSSASTEGADATEPLLATEAPSAASDIETAKPKAELDGID
jgi:hypothetical protein